MKVAVFAAYAVQAPHFETELELIHEHLDAGDDVTVLVCDGQLDACDPNPHHDLPRCMKCIGRRDAGLRALPEGVRIRPYFQLSDEESGQLPKLPETLESIDELKKWHVDGFDVGYGVASSLISLTRDPNLDLKKHAPLARAFSRAALGVYRSMQTFLKRQSIDRMYVFNGRFAVVRAVLRACQEAGVECFTHERGCTLQHYLLIRNTLPHDLQYMCREMWQAWRDAGETSDRQSVANAWYERRVVGDHDLSYVHRQQAERLPDGFDPGKRNIAIFISSEDEYASIGDSWQNPLYETQAIGLDAIIGSLRGDPKDLHLYLRVHPNLAGVDNEQTQALDRLQAPFLTVIPATDSVSTYALMRACDKVLSFGSTTGIEATYWGKPSVLAGMCFYRDFGVTHNPATHGELLQMLAADLAPKDREGALVYAYYLSTFGRPFKYFRADGFYTGRFKGRRIVASPLTKINIALMNVIYPSRVVRRLGKLVTRGYSAIKDALRPAA